MGIAEQQGITQPADDLEQAALPVADAAAQEGEQGSAEGEGADLVVTIGDPPPPAEGESEGAQDAEPHGPAPQWVRDMRRENRRLKRELASLQSQGQAGKGELAGPPAPGPKPTLPGCDWDADRYERDLEAWHERRRAADAATKAAAEKEAEAQKALQARVDAYQAGKAALRVPDYEEAEEVVGGLFDATQQGILLHGADNPALLVLALGRNPAAAKELAAIRDPVQFAFRAAKIESMIKSSASPANKPAPERRIAGGTAGAATTDQTLARLEREADRTGDRTAVIAYRRGLKNK